MISKKDKIIVYTAMNIGASFCAAAHCLNQLRLAQGYSRWYRRSRFIHVLMGLSFSASSGKRGAGNWKTIAVF